MEWGGVISDAVYEKIYITNIAYITNVLGLRKSNCVKWRQNKNLSSENGALNFRRKIIQTDRFNVHAIARSLAKMLYFKPPQVVWKKIQFSLS